MTVQNPGTQVVRRSHPKICVLLKGGQVGPFTITSSGIRAPGAWLFEATDPNGSRVQLQVARLQKAESKADRVRRSHFEQTVQSLTASLDGILSHGAVDDGDGGRILFWALPVVEPVQAESWSQLLIIGRALANRLVENHRAGRTDPLLSEQLIARSAEGLTIAGVPLHLSPEWLGEEMVASRLAPEERLTHTPSASGDLWRLGQALTVMALPFDPPNETVSKLLAALTLDDPKDRIQRATEAVVEIEAAIAEHNADKDMAWMQSATIAVDAVSPDLLQDLLNDSAGASTIFEPTLPFDLLDVNNDQTVHAVTMLPPDAVTLRQYDEDPAPKVIVGTPEPQEVTKNARPVRSTRKRCWLLRSARILASKRLRRLIVGALAGLLFGASVQLASAHIASAAEELPAPVLVVNVAE